MAYEGPHPFPIASGGTNAISMTNTDGVVYYDGTKLTTTTVGSATQVLTSNGSGMAPTFQAASAAGAITTIDGDTGSATGSTVTFTTFSSGSPFVGASAKFVASGSQVLLEVTDANGNTFLGHATGNTTLTGGNNTVVGFNSFGDATDPANCTALGVDTLPAVTTGANLIAIGYQSGINYSTEASNIVISNSGTVSDANTIRIGTQGSGAGQQNKCFIAGIEGVSVSNLNVVTINTSTGQLGSQAAANVGTVTQYDVLVGGAAGAIASVGPGTAQQLLVSGGASTNPSYKALSVKNQVFTSTGTYTPTSGMVYCIIQCLGGGGGGGGAAATGVSTTSSGGGGGSGEYAQGVFSAATIGSSQSVTIGGAGAANSGTTGGNGGTTSVGSTLISAAGGTGGTTAAASANTSQSGGLGGTGGSGGDFRTPGQNGGGGFTIAAPGVVLGSMGGSSQFGAGGGAVASSSSGTAGLGYGGGGGGGANYVSQSAVAGGAGTKGVVIVTEYIIA